MPTRNVVLTDHLDQVIDQLVASGRYQNASEVLRDGLRLVEQRENREAAKLAALRDAAQMGFSDIDEGRFLDRPGESVGELVAGLGRKATASMTEGGN